ncbi:MAG: hypothetical protein VB027_10905 [Gordonibacter sp.]|nr:hypothetical protein [Gordonibacter sp.]
MNQNYFVKCGVCGALHRVRIQAGYLEDYPVHFYCGMCDTPILGSVHLNPNIARVDYVLDEGSLAKKVEIDFSGDMSQRDLSYLVECSGELLTKKLTEDSLGDLHAMVGSNPFFRAVELIGPDRLNIYVKSMVEAIEHYRNVYPKIESTLRLFFNGQNNLAYNLLCNLTGESELDYPPSYNNLLVLAKRLSWDSTPLLADKSTEKRADEAVKMVRGLDYEKTNRLIGFYGDHGEDVFKLLGGCLELVSKYSKCFPYLITAFTYQESEGRYDLEKYGSSLCTVEDIRALYSDCYESLGKLVCFLIGLDNIEERSSFEKMGDGAPARSFENLYSKVSKGKLYERVGSGSYTSLVTQCWNRNLRNAFDHNSYKADSKSQAIIIVEDDGSIDDGKAVWIIEACCQCIEMLRSILVIREILFELAKKPADGGQ